MKVGLVAAMPGEIAPLVRGWAHREVACGGRTVRVHRGRAALARGEEAEVWACAAGIGSGPAMAACGAVREAAGGVLDAWVSYGWAGALTCGVKPPQVYVATEVVDAQTGERWLTDSPAAAVPEGLAAPLRTVTLDHVALGGEKRKLAERYRAVMVDMEGATVARQAAAHGERFHCIKGISDGYTDALPDLNRFLTPAGTMRTGALALYALLRPRYWRPLAQMGRQASAASAALARALPMCFGRAGLVS